MTKIRRPLAGFRFVISDAIERERRNDYRLEPTPRAVEIYRQHYEQSVSLRDLAEMYNLPPTNLKRLLHNVARYYDALQSYGRQ